MTLIWATRGRTWGFRFLRDGGLADPLPVYERAFADAAGGREFFSRDGDSVALRFVDPEGRSDRSGRPISHDFVVQSPLADEIHSLEDGRRLIWPLVADQYDGVWITAAAPEPQDRFDR